MKTYSDFNLELIYDEVDARLFQDNFYHKFTRFSQNKRKDRYKFYLDSYEYKEAKGIVQNYYSTNKQLFYSSETPITDHEELVIEYEQSDYDAAVCYCLRFEKYISDGYSSILTDKWFNRCCNNYYSPNETFFHFYTQQIANLNISKEAVKGLKSCGYTGVEKQIVSINIKEVLKTAGVDMSALRTVATKSNEIVCYQIDPQNQLSEIAHLNGWKPITACCNCKAVIYSEDHMGPYYITAEHIQRLQEFNRTTERFGAFSTPKIFINKKVFDILVNYCPLRCFIPVFKI